MVPWGTHDWWMGRGSPRVQMHGQLGILMPATLPSAVTLRVKGGEVPGGSVLAPKIGPLGMVSRAAACSSGNHVCPTLGSPQQVHAQCGVLPGWKRAGSDRGRGGCRAGRFGGQATQLDVAVGMMQRAPSTSPILKTTMGNTHTILGRLYPCASSHTPLAPCAVPQEGW